MENHFHCSSREFGGSKGGQPKVETMKKEILSMGQMIDVAGIENANFFEAKSFTEYDDIIIDPTCVSGRDPRNPQILRRRHELEDFFRTLGGNLICFLRPETKLYSWFPPIEIDLTFLDFQENEKQYTKKIHSAKFPDGFHIIAREGKTIGALNKRRSFARYFEELTEEIRYVGVIADEWQHLDDYVIARDRTRKIVAMELPVGIGKLILLPPNSCKDAEKVGGILRNCLEGLDGIPSSPPSIDWLGAFTLPGEKAIGDEIKKVEQEISALGEERQKQMSRLEGVVKYKVLLWAKHKHPLEGVVRAALRLIGFNVLEDDQYPEDYDIFAKEGDLFLVGEVEGSKGQIDVQKYRQLLAYCEQERVDKGHKVKGLLIGNGLCEQNPKERGEQFSPQTIRGCESQKFCYMTTYTLYVIVESILANRTDEALKEQIKEKILGTEGEFVLE